MPRSYHIQRRRCTNSACYYLQIVLRGKNLELAGGHLYRLCGQHLWLMPQKCIYWQEEQAILLADLHLGKAGHFRKAGIRIPAQVHRHDLQELGRAVLLTGAERVIVLGDLFHSQHNCEWQILEGWLRTYPRLEVQLIMGNHDWYGGAHLPAAITNCGDKLAAGPFLLTHEPLPEQLLTTDYYNLAGHVHPAVKLNGKGRQQLVLPCFLFTPGQGILPAFGKFTGTARTDVHPQDDVFVVAGSKIIPFSA